MKNLIWLIILFALAVVLALGAGAYSGNVWISAGPYLARIDLRAFLFVLLAGVILLYFLVRLFGTVFNVPGRLQRFGLSRKSKSGNLHLQQAGLAFFEGRFQKAEQEAAKVLANKQAGEHRNLALMLAAHAADQMDNLPLRDRYLAEIAKLPGKTQLSRYLLLAESALGRRDYPQAQENITAAAQINPNLTRLVKLQLRYAFDHGDAADVLDKTAKLQKAAALNEHETAGYQNWAYRRLLAEATDAKTLKACLKRIPDAFKQDSLCAAIAEKYEQLGLYASGVAWVQKYYPTNRQSALLPPFVQCVRYLDEKAQRKAIDTADTWLQQNRDDADLLMHLGQLAYSKQLWGKAQAYLEASLTVRESVQARLTLAKVFDETGDSAKAEAERKYALEDATTEETLALADLEKNADR